MVIISTVLLLFLTFGPNHYCGSRESSQAYGGPTTRAIIIIVLVIMMPRPICNLHLITITNSIRTEHYPQPKFGSEEKGAGHRYFLFLCAGQAATERTCHLSHRP